MTCWQRNRIDGGRNSLFRCGTFIAARSYRPSINVRTRPPEHLELTITDAMHRSVVTCNGLENNLAVQSACFGASLAAQKITRSRRWVPRWRSYASSGQLRTCRRRTRLSATSAINRLSRQRSRGMCDAVITCDSTTALGRQHETPAPQILVSGRGRRRVAGILAHGLGASLSEPANPFESAAHPIGTIPVVPSIPFLVGKALGVAPQVLADAAANYD